MPGMGHPEALRQGPAGRGPRRQGSEGVIELTALVGASPHVLQYPFVALALGVLVGAALLYSARLGISQVDPEQPEMALAWVLLSTSVRLTLAAACMAAVFFFVPTALVPFALGLGAGFFVMVNVELVRHAGMRRLLRKAGW